MYYEVQVAQDSLYPQSRFVRLAFVPSWLPHLSISARAIEYMMRDCFLMANRHLHFAEHVWNPQKYLYLNDSLILRIESSEEPVIRPHLMPF